VTVVYCTVGMSVTVSVPISSAPTPVTASQIPVQYLLPWTDQTQPRQSVVNMSLPGTNERTPLHIQSTNHLPPHQKLPNQPIPR